MCSGTLPACWGSIGSFPKLLKLDLQVTPLSGSLPTSWAQNGSLPSLETLVLEETKLSGNLPAEWGSQTAFPRLIYLSLDNYETMSSITGDMLQLCCGRVETWSHFTTCHTNTAHYGLHGGELCHSSFTASDQASCNGYTIQSHLVGMHKCMQ